MTSDDCALLEAFHEGRLDEAAATAWAAHLDADPLLRREIAAEVRLANGLRALVQSGSDQAAATTAARRSLELLAADSESRRRLTVARVLSRTRRRSWLGRWPWMVAAASLLAVVLVTFHASTTGSATVAWCGDRALVPGDRIDGGQLRYADGSRIDLADGSRLTLAGDGVRKRVLLDQGNLLAAITPQGPAGGFSVTTPHGDATVVGTRFRIQTDSRSALLQVDEGSVALRAQDTSRTIAAGGAALAVDGQVLPLPPPWTDRRPIGRWVISGTGVGGRLSGTNPNGWLHDPTITGEGLASRLAAETARIGQLSQRLGAQGVIIYGIEGAAAQLNAGFVGDPRRLPTLAADMEPHADAIFVRLRQAGLAVGISITPWRLVERDGRLVQLADPATALTELESKVGYAQRRWGCTLFYLNVSSPGVAPGHHLPDLAVQMLAARHPEILFIIENATPGQALAAAPQVLGSGSALPGRVCVRLPWNGAGSGPAAMARAKAEGDIIGIDMLAIDQVNAFP